jgi:hypothetical protein
VSETSLDNAKRPLSDENENKQKHEGGLRTLAGGVDVRVGNDRRIVEAVVDVVVAVGLLHLHGLHGTDKGEGRSDNEGKDEAGEGKGFHTFFLIAVIADEYFRLQLLY